MKKNILKVAFVVAIAMMTGINVFNAQKSDVLSDIALANVEALADIEDNPTGTKYGNASGTQFCCCPGSTRTCGASTCANC